MSYTELTEQEIIRRNSLKELENLGIETYPASEYKVDSYSVEIKKQFEETSEETTEEA